MRGDIHCSRGAIARFPCPAKRGGTTRRVVKGRGSRVSYVSARSTSQHTPSTMLRIPLPPCATRWWGGQRPPSAAPFPMSQRRCEASAMGRWAMNFVPRLRTPAYRSRDFADPPHRFAGREDKQARQDLRPHTKQGGGAPTGAPAMIRAAHADVATSNVLGRSVSRYRRQVRGAVCANKRFRRLASGAPPP